MCNFLGAYEIGVYEQNICQKYKVKVVTHPHDIKVTTSAINWHNANLMMGLSSKNKLISPQHVPFLSPYQVQGG